MKIRIWKLGSLEHDIWPTPAIVDRLAAIIAGMDGENDLDLVWTKDLEVEQIDLDLNAMDVISAAADSEVVIRIRNGVIQPHPSIRLVRWEALESTVIAATGQ